MNTKLKIASIVFLGLLLFPIFQQVTGLIHERKLKGSYSLADVPEFSLASWFSQAYQDSLELAAKDRFGFHTMFIRLNNQVNYSLFKKPLANGVVIGKNNYLYELNYIKAYKGTDFIGDSLIEINTRKLKKIQDYLEVEGKYFLVTFAAGKGSFYPEFFPEKYKQDKPVEKTNLNVYKRYFDAYGINYIDFNKWFLEMKDTSQYCLYPRTGVHWSYYGMVLVIDSLRTYLENVTGREMPQLKIKAIEEGRRYRSSDKDIEDGMNIIFRINHDKLAYPRVSINDTGIDKLSGVIIADSFYWGLHNIGFSNRMLEKGEYWYYNNRIISNEPVELDTIDRLERLKDKDVIILMATEATLPNFPFGFGDLLK